MSYTSDFGGTQQNRATFLAKHPLIIDPREGGAGHADGDVYDETACFDAETMNDAESLPSGRIIQPLLMIQPGSPGYGISDRFVVEYTQTANLYYEIFKEGRRVYNNPMFKGSYELRIYSAQNANNTRKRLQYLPWQESKITWMRLGNNPRFFITGPLSGCQVYVATQGMNTYVYHANSNAMGGGNGARRPDLSIPYMDALYARAAGVGKTLRYRLEKDTYCATREVRQDNGTYVTEMTATFQTYKTAKETSKMPHRTARTDVDIPKGSAFAFVFGVRTLVGWRFYYHVCAMVSYKRGWFRWDVNDEFKVVVPCAPVPAAPP